MKKNLVWVIAIVLVSAAFSVSAGTQEDDKTTTAEISFAEGVLVFTEYPHADVADMNLVFGTSLNVPVGTISYPSIQSKPRHGFAVSDSRATPDGWHVTVQAGSFKDKAIPIVASPFDGILNFQNENSGISYGSDVTKPVDLEIITSAASMMVASAQPTAGRNQFVFSWAKEDVSLDLAQPNSSLITPYTSYVSVVTWTLTTEPNP